MKWNILVIISEKQNAWTMFLCCRNFVIKLIYIILRCVIVTLSKNQTFVDDLYIIVWGIKRRIKVLQNPLEDFSVRMLVIIYALTSCTFIMHVSNVNGERGLGTGHTVSDDLTCCFIMTFICYHFFKFWSMAFFFSFQIIISQYQLIKWNVMSNYM